MHKVAGFVGSEASDGVASDVMDATDRYVEATDRFEALYRAESARLWRAVVAYAGDVEIADDAVAEAFAQLVQRGSAVRDPAAWTWRAAFRISKGALKARSAEVTLVGDVRGVAPPIDVDRFADPDLVEALRALPEAQRAAVVLFYYADLPIRQIAARLGTSALAVRANLSRGRRRLRDLLGEHHG